jgi:excisionase family DNA binding protein
MMGAITKPAPNYIGDKATTLVWAVRRPCTQSDTSEPAPLVDVPGVLSVDELARFLRVNRKTIYEAIARGEIPGARRIGRTYRIDRQAVLDWLKGQGRALRSRR